MAHLCVDGGLCDEARDGVTRMQKLDEGTAEGQELAGRMREAYDRLGLVNVRNTGLTRGKDMKALVTAVTGGAVRYEGGANPRDSVPEQSVYDTGAPLDSHIHYHHEMAYIEETVANLGFVCLANSDPANKGHTFIAHNAAVTDLLMDPTFGKGTGVGQKLKEKGLCYIRRLPDRKFFEDNAAADASLVYNYWQRSFLTNDPAEAERQAKENKGLDVEWVDSPVFGRCVLQRGSGAFTHTHTQRADKRTAHHTPSACVRLWTRRTLEELLNRVKPFSTHLCPSSSSSSSSPSSFTSSGIW